MQSLLLLLLACGTSTPEPATPKAAPKDEPREDREPSMSTMGLLSFDGDTAVLVPCRGTDRMELSLDPGQRAKLLAKHNSFKQDRGSSFLRVIGRLKPGLHPQKGRLYDGTLKLKSISEHRPMRIRDCDIALMDPILPTIPSYSAVQVTTLGDDALDATMTVVAFEPDVLVAPGLNGWAAHLTHAFTISEAWCSEGGRKRRPGASIDWTLQDPDGASLGSARILCANARTLVHRLSNETRSPVTVTVDGTDTAWQARPIELNNLGDVTEYARRSFGFPRK